MTPLIDVLLALLIIFMVLVPVRPRGMNSSLPQDKASTPSSQPTVVELSAGAMPGEVSFRVNQREVAREAVEPTLRGIFAMQPERTIYLKADRKLSYEPVAWVAGQAKLAGVSNLIWHQRSNVTLQTFIDALILQSYDRFTLERCREYHLG